MLITFVTYVDIVLHNAELAELRLESCLSFHQHYLGLICQSFCSIRLTEQHLRLCGAYLRYFCSIILKGRQVLGDEDDENKERKREIEKERTRERTCSSQFNNYSYNSKTI
jgi:hypothetical protein